MLTASGSAKGLLPMVQSRCAYSPILFATFELLGDEKAFRFDEYVDRTHLEQLQGIGDSRIHLTTDDEMHPGTVR